VRFIERERARINKPWHINTPGPGRPRPRRWLVEKARTKKSGRIATEATEAKTQARFIAFVRERRRLFHINTVILLSADEIGEACRGAKATGIICIEFCANFRPSPSRLRSNLSALTESRQSQRRDSFNGENAKIPGSSEQSSQHRSPSDRHDRRCDRDSHSRIRPLSRRWSQDPSAYVSPRNRCKLELSVSRSRSAQLR